MMEDLILWWKLKNPQKYGNRDRKLALTAVGVVRAVIVDMYYTFRIINQDDLITCLQLALDRAERLEPELRRLPRAIDCSVIASSLLISLIRRARTHEADEREERGVPRVPDHLMREELIEVANMLTPNDHMEEAKPVCDVIVEHHHKDKGLCEGMECKITTSQALIHQYLNQLTEPGS